MKEKLVKALLWILEISTSNIVAWFIMTALAYIVVFWLIAPFVWLAYYIVELLS